MLIISICPSCSPNCSINDFCFPICSTRIFRTHFSLALSRLSVLFHHSSLRSAANVGEARWTRRASTPLQHCFSLNWFSMYIVRRPRAVKRSGDVNVLLLIKQTKMIIDWLIDLPLRNGNGILCSVCGTILLRLSVSKYVNGGLVLSLVNHLTGPSRLSSTQTQSSTVDHRQSDVESAAAIRMRINSKITKIHYRFAFSNWNWWFDMHENN